MKLSNAGTIAEELNFRSPSSPEPPSRVPQSLQKLALGTTTGAPHCEQKRGCAPPVSAMEHKGRVAQAQVIAVDELALTRDAPSGEKGAILTAKVAQGEAAVEGNYARVMA